MGGSQQLPDANYWKTFRGGSTSLFGAGGTKTLLVFPQTPPAYKIAAGYSSIRLPFSITSAVIASTCGVGTAAARAKACTEVRMPSISGGRAASKSCSIEDLCGIVGALG